MLFGIAKRLALGFAHKILVLALCTILAYRELAAFVRANVTVSVANVVHAGFTHPLGHRRGSIGFAELEGRAAVASLDIDAPVFDVLLLRACAQLMSEPTSAHLFGQLVHRDSVMDRNYPTDQARSQTHLQ